ncbi:hypothetical protein ALC60_08336 [Trachymyrmex zeteki]|uniref:Uncharacterized protein n=1 Tax=Mycetomoellerius zeteki TaxID=64791 RepID=A0A151WXE1_9HYME|nr:hypothetical protein ALC60_08336 [Trachymyrmex zeteki]
MATLDPPGCRVERCAAGCGPPGDDFAIPLRLTVLAIVLALSDYEKIVFISTVVRMDGVPVIYVPAQTHLIYSTKHNSLTLFRGKVLVYLGYASKSREFHAWHARMSNLPRARFLPYFTFCLSSDSCVPFDTDFVSGTFDLVNRSDLTSDTFFFLSHDIFVKVCAALRKI